jgi:hypothetical protein
LAARVLDAEEGAGVARGQHAGRDTTLDRDRQLQQPDRVRDHRAAAADAVCELGLRDAELREQLLVGGRLVERVQLDPVDVLQQGVAKHRVVAGVPDDRRQALQPGPLRGTPAPLAHDELVGPGGRLADDDRLQETELADRVLQLREGIFVEGGARLVRVGLDGGEVDLAEGRAGHRGLGGAGGSRCGRRRGSRSGGRGRTRGRGDH